jgi:WhiB family redox-sensing transcriptional regulator
MVREPMNAPVPLRRFVSRIVSAGPSTRPGDWIRDPRRACANVDPDIFFPDTSNANTLIKQARAICAACPFRVDCAEYAISEPMIKGVWGGTTEIDRRRIRHRRRLESM